MAVRHANSIYDFAYEDPDYTGDPERDMNFIDAPLSEQGIKECKVVAKFAHIHLPNLKSVFVSPLR